MDGHASTLDNTRVIPYNILPPGIYPT